MDALDQQPGAKLSSPQVAGFSLLNNPFAILGATPRTPNSELPELADTVGTAGAAAALRLLLVPRTRLNAEVAFLPGAAEMTPNVLAALRRNEAPKTAALPAAAQANVLAHLCAAGMAAASDEAALAALQAPPGDPSLAASINGDRTVAGVPPLQPAALLAEQEVLLDQHAAALVAGCLAGPDPAARLAALIREAPAGPASAFLRAVAAGWARQSAPKLTGLEDAAAHAKAALLSKPGLPGVEALCRAMRDWGALSLPQRLSDARAGLDHGPTLAAMRPWRAARSRLAEDGRPDLALPLAQALAAVFADLPGEAMRLQEEAQACAGMLEEQTLEPRLTPLRAMAERFRTAPAPLESALATHPFGPGATGAAAELWAAFDAACAACVVSEAPWTILRTLAIQLGGEHKMAGAANALTLQRGMVARAEASGLASLANRLRAEQNGLERVAARWTYLELADGFKRSWSGPVHRRRVLAACRRALALATDPAERGVLTADMAKLQRGSRSFWLGMASLAAAVGAVVMVIRSDDGYTRDAPYRHAPAQTLALASLLPGVTREAVVEAPVPAPLPVMPVMPPPMTAVPLMVPPVSLEPPVPHLAFLVRNKPPERQPQTNLQVYTLAETRWCVFNEVRLDSAIDAATTPALKAALQPLQREWLTECSDYNVHRRDIEQAKSERDHVRARLASEGEAMLRPAP